MTNANDGARVRPIHNNVGKGSDPKGGCRNPNGGYRNPKRGYRNPKGGYRNPKRGYRNPRIEEIRG
jgi:hypothetical protein